MHIYFSGVGGVGIGPLAEIAYDAGYTVSGSDKETSPMSKQLASRGVTVHIAQSTATIEKVHAAQPIDWFVHTAALPPDHPELVFANRHNIRVSKRDELLAFILKEKKLQLVAVAGTHGKTTTTSMLVWAFRELGIPLSYSVGAKLSFGPSGKFDPKSKYFVYECDEYDRNMLQFEPQLSLITALDYDHPDTYKSEHVYKNAFVTFIEQSTYTLLWEKDLRYLAQPDLSANYEAYDEYMDLSRFTLPGNHVRHNAFLAEQAISHLFENTSSLVEALNAFPGSGRRFEKLAPNLYSDYGHHPTEIAATLQLARELSDHVVLVYQPHQNVRQHEIKDSYTDCMEQAEAIYWLPTYLSREDPALPVLTPEELTSELTNKAQVQIADMNDQLWQTLLTARQAGKLVVVMGAGEIDAWARQQL